MHPTRALLLLTLCGCAGGGLSGGGASPTTTRMETGGGGFEISSVASERVTSQAVAAPVERVWAALPAAFQAVGLSGGGVISQSERIFGTPLLRFRGRLAGERASRYLNCGRNPIGAAAADMYQMEAVVRSSVRPNSDGTTRLEVLVEATAAAPAGGTRTTCATTRALEERIVAEVRRVAGA
jgi:hypothetical protein